MGGQVPSGVRGVGSGLPQADAEALLAAIRVLRDQGPNLGRPLIDTIKGSRHANMKELCSGSTGRTEVRVLFAFDLEAALELNGQATQPQRPHRRKPGVLDPFAVYREGDDVLRRRLSQLSVEELKDIVAQHGMDRSKLAMKWRTPDRFIALIVETVQTRARKGDAFRDLGNE